MSAAGYGSVEYFMTLPLDELVKTVKEVNRIAKEQRVRVSNQNSRRG